MSAPFSCPIEVPKLPATKIEVLTAVVLANPAFEPLLAQTEEHLMQADFLSAAALLQAAVDGVVDHVLGHCLNQVLANEAFRRQLRLAAVDAGLSFHSNQTINVQMPNGHHLPINSPWFNNPTKGGRRKVGPKRADSSRKGAHLGLDVMGFFGKVCPSLALRGMVMGILCPSLAIACSLLADDGITLSQNKLRSIFACFDGLEPKRRAELSCAPNETLAGKRVGISIDGARFRERVTKKGRVPEDNKRRGFETPWREPKLFNIFVLDDKGDIDDEAFAVQVDGSTGDRGEQLDKALLLLRAYLEQLDIAEAAEVTLLGDGAPWIWNRVPALLHELGLPEERLVQIIDYYHAKENLNELLGGTYDDLDNPREQLRQKATKQLFDGELDKAREALLNQAMNGCKRWLKNKFDDYFLGNAERLCYRQMQATHPIGSGCVESAVRRVINLRIKAPGVFWSEEKAETMIFLRAKLLYGRWPIFVNNWLRLCRGSFQPPAAPN